MHDILGQLYPGGLLNSLLDIVVEEIFCRVQPGLPSHPLKETLDHG
jgi:hypothetical protein